MKRVAGVVGLLLHVWILSGQVSGWEKCSPLLRHERLQSRALSDSLRCFTVRTTGNGLQQILEKAGGRVLFMHSPTGVMVVECPEIAFFTNCLSLPEVVFADEGFIVGNEEVIVPGHNLFTNQIRKLQAHRPLLDGHGTVISIKEFSFDTADVDFRNRILPNPHQNLDSRVHASIMATLAGGGANADPAGGGVAPGCKLISSSFEGLLPDEDADYVDYQIAVQNHSYGSGIQNYYGANALAYDQSVIDHPQLVHVFSAGNEGGSTPTTGMYANIPGFSNITGNYKMAKNVLTVGAIDSFDRILPFSSRGPAYDGRLKPDLVAFGADGTSSAAALVSGAAAVVQQAFFEKFGYRPDADLVKAILINSANDLGVPGPDFIYGYGNLNLDEAVQQVEQGIMAVSEVEASQKQVFYLDALPGNMRQLKITLHWNDVPAEPGTAKALINDLDLQVITPDGDTILPLVVHTFPNADTLLLPAFPGPDTLNNTEQINLENPVGGTYQVIIYGRSVVTAYQSYAFAANWDTIGHFDWVSPVKNDPFPAGKKVVLRWETNISTEKGIIEWQPIGSSTWLPVDTSALLLQHYLRWTAPDTFTAARLRMKVGVKEWLSDTFLITAPLRLKVAYNCPDSAMVYWSPVADHAEYRLWGLGNQYLEPLLTTNDTFAVLSKNLFPQQRFAVSAQTAGGTVRGPLSSAPDIANQGAGCFISTLLAQLNVQNEVDLLLQLGTVTGVERVFIDKLQQQQWNQFATGGPLLTSNFTDKTPQTGVNTYRPRLLMANGGVITGDPVEVYFAGNTGFVFPNPASGMIAVLFPVGDEPVQFVLRDVPGRLIKAFQLEGAKTDLSLPALQPGIYFWEVKNEAGARLSSGKLLIGR